MTDQTRANVEAAFVGEAKAHFRLLAFAGKADVEGYPQVARLFRAVAAAEAAHATSHFELLEEVHST
jgi:rubrerythrin